MAIPEYHARLTTGRQSYTVPLDSIDQLLQEVEGPENSNHVDGPMPSSLRNDPVERPTTVLERSGWQSFILALQLHHPEMAADIDPAHKIGKLPFTRVVLTLDGIDFLRHWMEQWYGGEVEIHTVSLARAPHDMPDGVSDCFMKTPFRPVTGLDLVVVPVYYRPISKREAAILLIKEKVCWAQGLSGLGMARKLYAREEWRTSPVTRKKAGGAKAWTKWILGSK